MSIKNLLPALAIAVGIASAVFTPVTTEARHRQKVVYKHKRVHHRHKIGLRHIGRGTKTTTKVKTSH